MIFERTNPLTGAVASRAQAMPASDMPAVAARAAAAFPAWAATGPNARRALLMKAAAALEARGDDFVEAMTSEIGATRGWKTPKQAAWSDFILKNVASRDFSVVVFLFALLDTLNWFLWMAALGSTVFWLMMLWVIRPSARARA